MNNKELIDKYNYRIDKICINKNIRIIDTVNEKLIVKEKKKDLKNVFKYLNSKTFDNYLNYINSNEDSYYIYPYLNDIEMSTSDKAKELMYLVSVLHSKTYTYESFYEDEIKTFYENIKDSIEELEIYYNNLRLVIEESIYMSPSHYLLLKNISWVFYSLDSSKYFIDKWYEKVKDKKDKRVCLLHGNLELNHILGDTNRYLISWDNAYYDNPIYDLLIFYNKHYDELDFYSLFNIYENKFPLLEEEKYLLFSLMFIPKKILFEKEEILNTKDVYDNIKYLQVSSNIVSKYYSKDTDKQTQE